ncbi:MAG: acyl-CoA thioesterase [Alphaproteobacteria bacterium]
MSGSPASSAAPSAPVAAKPTAPRGELSIRVLAMPADTNQNGDIFGGWLLGQMDIAGSIFAYKIAKGRTVTVAVDAMSFKKPVFVGDVVGIYTEILHIGHTSICVHIEAWVTRRSEQNMLMVTEGNFTYVALDDNGRPRPVQS